MSRSTIRRPALSVALLLSWSCTFGPQTADPAPEPPQAEGVRSVPLLASVQLEVEGAELVEIDEEVRLMAVEISGEGIPPDTYYLSVGSRDHIELPDGTQLRFAVAVGSGKWRGAGEYLLEDAPEGMTIPDEVFVEFTRPGADASETVRYVEFAQPCTVTIGASGFDGSATCPALRAEDAEATVAVTIAWVGRLDPVPTDPFITPPPALPDAFQ